MPGLVLRDLGRVSTDDIGGKQTPRPSTADGLEASFASSHPISLKPSPPEDGELKFFNREDLEGAGLLKKALVDSGRQPTVRNFLDIIGGEASKVPWVAQHRRQPADEKTLVARAQEVAVRTLELRAERALRRDALLAWHALAWRARLESEHAKAVQDTAKIRSKMNKLMNFMANEDLLR